MRFKIQTVGDEVAQIAPYVDACNEEVETSVDFDRMLQHRKRLIQLIERERAVV